MDSNFLAELAVIGFAGGLIAGLIAYYKTNSVGALIGYFIFGALFPLFGVLIACFIKRPAPAWMPGWYRDPMPPYGQRYWDGVAWTQHTA